jgi:hypothetical protein
MEVHFDSEWQRDTRQFHPILWSLEYDRIEIGLMGLILSFVWPHHSPDGSRHLDEVFEELGVDVLLPQSEVEKLRKIFPQGN